MQCSTAGRLKEMTLLYILYFIHLFYSFFFFNPFLIQAFMHLCIHNSQLYPVRRSRRISHRRRVRRRRQGGKGQGRREGGKEGGREGRREGGREGGKEGWEITNLKKNAYLSTGRN